jgi:hypothetical protein
MEKISESQMTEVIEQARKRVNETQELVVKVEAFGRNAKLKPLERSFRNCGSYR